MGIRVWAPTSLVILPRADAEFTVRVGGHLKCCIFVAFRGSVAVDQRWVVGARSSGYPRVALDPGGTMGYIGKRVLQQYFRDGFNKLVPVERLKISR